MPRTNTKLKNTSDSETKPSSTGGRQQSDLEHYASAKALDPMNEVRQIAMDMLVMASRCEADAMIVKFFSHFELPAAAAAGMLEEFRDFRATLDDEKIEHDHRGPVTGEEGG